MADGEQADTHSRRWRRCRRCHGGGWIRALKADTSSRGQGQRHRHGGGWVRALKADTSSRRRGQRHRLGRVGLGVEVDAVKSDARSHIRWWRGHLRIHGREVADGVQAHAHNRTRRRRGGTAMEEVGSVR